MSMASLRECLDRLGWSTIDLAERAAVSPVTVRRWLSGKVPVPANIVRTLEQMAALAEPLTHRPG
jgi:transcriptional regulator with XRE-family HTH domain